MCAANCGYHIPVKKDRGRLPLCRATPRPASTHYQWVKFYFASGGRVAAMTAPPLAMELQHSSWLVPRPGPRP